MQFLKRVASALMSTLRLVFDRTRRVFETRRVGANGEKVLNKDLLKKVRTIDDNGEYVVSGRISLDDLPRTIWICQRMLLDQNL
jgi:prophage DNA circulation protein